MKESVNTPSATLPASMNATGSPSLGERIRVARGKMRQAELAEKSGVSDRTISTLEQGKQDSGGYKPKAETVARLALALNVADPMEWVQLCEDCSSFKEDDLQSLREEMMQPPKYRPAEELMQDVMQDVEKTLESRYVPAQELIRQIENHSGAVNSDLQKVKSEIDTLNEHIKSMPLTQQQLQQLSGMLQTLLPNQGYERAETLKREFSNDLARAETRLIARADDLRRIVDQMGEQIKLLTSLVQTQVTAALRRPE